MKKYAMLIMNSKFEQQNVQWICDEIEHYIITTRSLEETQKKVISLVKQGFGAIELCGAFGKEAAENLYQLINCKIPIGYVVYSDDQIEALSAFWENKE